MYISIQFEIKLIYWLLFGHLLNKSFVKQTQDKIKSFISNSIQRQKNVAFNLTYFSHWKTQISISTINKFSILCVCKLVWCQSNVAKDSKICKIWKLHWKNYYSIFYLENFGIHFSVFIVNNEYGHCTDVHCYDYDYFLEKIYFSWKWFFFFMELLVFSNLKKI